MAYIVRVLREDGTWAEIPALIGPKGEAFKYSDFTPEQLAALKGEPGQPGAYIVSFERTSGNGQPGTTDIYTMTFSNGLTFDVPIYNGANGKDGEDGEGSGDMLASVYDPQDKRQDVFAYADTQASAAQTTANEAKMAAANAQAAIPTKTSQLANDSGYLTSAPVTSVNGATGAVQFGADDIGAAKIKSPNDMIHNTNEYTFIPAGYEGVVHINDKTADGSQGNVTTYYFRDGKGGLSEVVVRSLQASDISVTGSFKAGLYKTDESEAALRISDNNEFNFGAQGNTLYIGYENRIGSSGYVDTYCFGRHTGGNDSEKGTIKCGRVVEGGTALSDKYVAKGQTETWTFTLEDGSTVTKAVYVG